MRSMMCVRVWRLLRVVGNEYGRLVCWQQVRIIIASHASRCAFKLSLKKVMLPKFRVEIVKVV